MSTGIHKHRCKNIRLENFLPSINCVILTIETGGDRTEDLEITLFGLSEKKAERLVAAISEIEKMEDE